MAKSIEPNPKKVGEYLKLEKDVFFEVPEYQRAYSWDIARCDKLWQDITDYIASDNKDRYFFGTIIVNCQDNDTRYVLIDGQQRTTSFLLLLKALLININDAIEKTSADPDSINLCNGLKERRRKIIGILYKAEAEDIADIPDQNKDRILYQSAPIILKNNSINERYKDELSTILNVTSLKEAEEAVFKIPYKQKDNKYTNYFKNFKFFYNKAKEQRSPSQLNSFARCITEYCEVIEIKSWQVDQAITMFNSLNSDGMPLYDSDIISAQFYAEAETKKEGATFTNLWKNLLDIIDAPNLREIISIDSILMQHMYYVRAFKKEIINESGNANVTTPGLRRYYLSGDGSCRDTIIKQPIESCRQMLNIAKIWNAVADNAALKVLLKFNENAKLFLGSYFYRFDDTIPSMQEVTLISEIMLRLFAVLELVDAGYSSSKFKSFLFAEEIKLIDPSISLDKIKEDFSLHIKKNWERDRLKSELMDNESNSLVYLNEYLFAKEKNIAFSFSDKYDIEHIMPSSGRNQQEIQKDAGIKTGDEFKSFVNKLGNKILLEVKINRSIGNEWFRTKVSTKLNDKTGYVDSTYPLAKALVNKYKNTDKPYWLKEDIKDATGKACMRILDFVFD